MPAFMHSLCCLHRRVWPKSWSAFAAWTNAGHPCTFCPFIHLFAKCRFVWHARLSRILRATVRTDSSLAFNSHSLWKLLSFKIETVDCHHECKDKRSQRNIVITTQGRLVQLNSVVYKEYLQRVSLSHFVKTHICSTSFYFVALHLAVYYYAIVYYAIVSPNCLQSHMLAC